MTQSIVSSGIGISSTHANEVVLQRRPFLLSTVAESYVSLPPTTLCGACPQPRSFHSYNDHPKHSACVAEFTFRFYRTGSTPFETASGADVQKFLINVCCSNETQRGTARAVSAIVSSRSATRTEVSRALCSVIGTYPVLTFLYLLTRRTPR